MEITPITVGWVGLLLMVILLFTGIHIAVVMGLLGFLGMALLSGWGAALGVLKTVPYTTFASYDFSVLPLFILMGAFCFWANISGDLYDTVYKFLGNLRGGLAMATVGACAGFAAVCGSSMATAATMGTVALPEMKKKGYSPVLATGTIAAGGTIGILIPPSVPMVIYGMLTEQSIGKLFLAGFIPGIIQALLFIIVVWVCCRINPTAGPPGARTALWTKIASLKNTWIVLALFVLVIGGLYAGVFSPTEAAGVGACGAFLFALGRRRLGWKEFTEALRETAKTTGMIFFIVVGAYVLNYFLAVSRLPFTMATAMTALPVHRYVIWLFIVLLYVFLGCIMDSLAMILLTVPILFPVIVAMGFDPIWFGIQIVILIELGMITPPVGLNVFVIKGMVPDVPTFSIFKGIAPYCFAMIFELVLLTVFPSIVLILPSIMK